MRDAAEAARYKPDFVSVCTSEHSRAGSLILQFLEGIHLVGPGLDTFKLAMLNKKMHGYIKSKYEISDFRDFAVLHSKQSILSLYSSQPSFVKYSNNSSYVKNIRAAMTSSVCGGSVLDPIRATKVSKGGSIERKADDGSLASKQNGLRAGIVNFTVDPASGGGFYALKNLRTPSHTFLDIWILLDGGISSKEDLVKLERISKGLPADPRILAPKKSGVVESKVKGTWTTRTASSPGRESLAVDTASRSSRGPGSGASKKAGGTTQMNSKLLNPQSYEFFDIKHLLTGYCRMIEFGSFARDKD